MANKKTDNLEAPLEEGQAVEVPVVETPKQAFAFPELGKTVEAESLEEAQKQL